MEISQIMSAEEDLEAGDLEVELQAVVVAEPANQNRVPEVTLLPPRARDRRVMAVEAYDNTTTRALYSRTTRH
jgi:hypothetical protein